MRRAAPLLAVLGLVALLVGAPPAGAEVDPPAGRAVAWGQTCLAPGPVRYTVYGQGWPSADEVQVIVSNGGEPFSTVLARPVVQVDRGGVFQLTFDLPVPSGQPDLVLHAEQPSTDQRSADQRLEVRGDCRPTLTTRPLIACSNPGQTVPVEITGAGWPSTTTSIKHYVDLFGASERVDRGARDRAGYAFTIGVDGPPGGTLALTGEGVDGRAFRYVTTTVTLPPRCGPPPTAPGATTTTLPGAASTTTAPLVTVVPPPSVPSVVGQARVALSPALGVPGETVLARGSGFPPNAPVLLRWQPGVGQWAATARADGTFELRVLVLPKDVLGRRTLVASTSVAVPPAPYLVVAPSASPSGFDAALFLRG